MKSYRRKAIQLQRNGAVAVEAAIIMPVLLLITIGAIDIGQLINISQTVSNSSRVGARLATRDVTESVAEVESAILNYFFQEYPHEDQSALANAIQIDVSREDGTPIPTGDLSDLVSGTPIAVTVSIDFAAIRWIQGPNYFSADFQSTTTIGRRE